MQEINVICLKWGSYYGHNYVNSLYEAVNKYTSKYKLNFYCFTEDAENLDPNIIVKPLPELKNNKYAFLKEAGLCDDNLGGLNGQRVLFFDLDSVLCSNIDCFFDLALKDDKFYIHRDFGSDSDLIGGSNVYSWVVGTLGYIKDDYEKNHEEITEKYYTASQEYLSAKVIERYGKLNFWPDEWLCSFKKHCMQPIILRYFLAPKRPKKEVRLINFHGDPKIHDALNGNWSTRKTIPLHKRLYKYTRPARWIAEYWKL